MSNKLILIVCLSGLFVFAGCATTDKDMMDKEMMEGAYDFTIVVENVSGGSALPTPFAPGIFVVHHDDVALFSEGSPDGGLGLEALAEDGNPEPLFDSLSNNEMIMDAGIFAIPTGSSSPGPLLPGDEAYEFSFTAVPGELVSFALMFVQSNDLFFAPVNGGINLFSADGTPIVGDVSSYLALWDAGTEVNEEPGTGPNQAPRQGGPNTGATEGGPIVEVNDRYSYPKVSELIKVTIVAEMM